MFNIKDKLKSKKNLDQLIEEKTRDLEKLVGQRNKLQQVLRQIAPTILRLDGELTGLKRAKELQKK